MSKLLKSILLGLGLAFLVSGLAQAKDVAKPAASAAASTSASASAAKPVLIDINSATKKELSALPKIGDARADAIVNGRPYKGKDELVTKKILTPNLYLGIKNLIIAKQKPEIKK